MKTLRLLTMLMLLVSCHAYAKPTKAETQNRIYFKLLLLNEKDEILLVEFSNIWEPIGGEYKTALRMEEFVEQLAMTSNAKVKDIRLRGLFSVFNGKAKQPMCYHYYTARYVSGDIKPPADCSGAKWVNLEEAKKIMTYTDMLKVYEMTLESDDLFGGSYRIIKNRKKGTRKVEQVVDFFKLN